MNRAGFKPLQNTSLPHLFRHIRLKRAREHSRREGASAIGCIIVAPLDTASQIDAEVWKTHRDACRIVRQRPKRISSAISCMARAEPGAFTTTWLASLKMNPDTISPTNASGEYVSVREDDGMHPYRFVAVTPL